MTIFESAISLQIRRDLILTPHTHFACAYVLEQIGRSVEATGDWPRALELDDPPLPGPIRSEAEQHLRDTQLAGEGRRHLVGVGKRRS